MKVRLVFITLTRESPRPESRAWGARLFVRRSLIAKIGVSLLLAATTTETFPDAVGASGDVYQLGARLPVGKSECVTHTRLGLISRNQLSAGPATQGRSTGRLGGERL